MRTVHNIHAMKLSDYMAREGLTQVVFAARSGLSQSTVSRLLDGADGSARPSWDTLAAIFRATGGEVGPNDFFTPELEPKRTEAAE